MNHIGTILYVHGMGGGKDSRIPAILRECFSSGSGPDVIVRTYDFDPEKAREQLLSWYMELKPSLIVGESLGANHAIALRRAVSKAGIVPYAPPVILVSPALGAPVVFSRLSFLALIPGVGTFLDHRFKPRPGERQKIRFRYDILRKWNPVRKDVLDALKGAQSGLFAFFGTEDRYRRSGIVSLSGWKRLCGGSRHFEYCGTHYMEEEFVKTLLVGKILDMLGQEERYQVVKKADL